MWLSRLAASLILTVSFTASLKASSGQLAGEPFSYPAGALNGASGGYGWSGPWQTQNGNASVPGYNVASATPLSAANQAGSYATGGVNWQTTGRSLDTTASGPFASVLASPGLIGKPGATLYFSLLLRKDVNTDDEMSVTLHPGASAPWWAGSPGVSVGHFGSGSNLNGVRYWSLKVAGTVYRTSTPIALGQAAQLVGKLDFGAITTVSLFVNPSASALPSTPGASASTTASMAFQSLAWNAGTGAGQSSLDEIRFTSGYSALQAAQPPAAPASLTAVPGNTQITLQWTAVPGASAYRVFQVVNGVPQLTCVASTNSALISGLVNYETYTFYVETFAGSLLSHPSASVSAVPVGPAPVPHPALGTNLSQVTDFSRELPFVDVFKMARRWIPQLQGGSWGQGPALALDEHGWVSSLQPGQYAETILLDNALDDHANYPAGQYTVLYEGQGTIQFDLQSATIVSQSPGRMIVNVNPAQNGVFLMVTATNPANHLRNIRFLMPGHENTYLSQPFNPVFLQRLTGYRVLRFMEWMLTNGSAEANWSDRAQTADYTWTWRGVPAEIMIQLANTTGVAPWFNVPAPATDAWVKQFAALVDQQLNRSLHFYLEYSNETWNGGFSQKAWVQAQGKAAGFSTDPTLAGFYYTAHRAAQIFGLARTVIPAPGRMILVMAAQAANSWLSGQMLAFQNSFASADALAIAPYFNCDDTAAGGFGVLGDPSTAAAVDNMSVDQVIDIELAHINGCAKQQMESSAAVARKYGLKLLAYEGGQSLVGYWGAENDPVMTALFKAANRSTRMVPLYAQYLANWVAGGGDLLAHFSDVTAYTKYGSWGALEYQDQDPNTAPKYQALSLFASQHP